MEIYEIKDADIVYSAAVDFGTRTCSKEVHIVQYDNSLPIIAVKLYREGVYYSLPDGYEANLRFSKKDKTFIYKPVLGCDSTRTVVYFVVDEQMSLIAGDVYPIIELTYNGSVVGSSTITFIIDKNPIQIGDIESQSDYPAITERISAAETKATNAESMAKEAKESADDARDKMSKIDDTYAKIEYVDSKDELLESSLNGEISRATTKENSILSSLNGEISRATAKENSIISTLDNKISSGDYVNNINVFNYGGAYRKLYDGTINDSFFAANLKWWVTLTYHKQTDNGITYPYIDSTKSRTDKDYWVDGPITFTDNNPSGPFDGNFESAFAVIHKGEYVKVHIQCVAEINFDLSDISDCFPGYPYGSFIIGVYDRTYPEKILYRAYNKYAPHTYGWYSAEFINKGSTRQNMIVHDEGDFQRNCMEFLIFGPSSSDTQHVNLLRFVGLETELRQII